MGWLPRLKKRRQSEAFRSRFLDAAKDAAPIRHARQLRDHLAGLVVQSVLLAGFLVALALFARSVVHLFERHGAELNPWYLRLCLAGILVCFVLFARRMVGRILEIRDVRRDLHDANRQLERLRDDLRRSQDD
jgi:pilus assembly protein TadC